jgi:hypothetical protein
MDQAIARKVDPCVHLAEKGILRLGPVTLTALRLMGTPHLVSAAVLPVQQFNERTFRKTPGLRGIWPHGAAAVLETLSNPDRVKSPHC